MITVLLYNIIPTECKSNAITATFFFISAIFVVLSIA